jgi:hypothetical protein
MVECGDCHGELAHRVKSGRAAVDDLLYEVGYLSTSSPVAAKLCNLLGGWNFASEEQPEETFWERF